MNKETRMLLAAASIALALLVIVLLIISGADLSGIRIHKGIRLN